MGEQNHKPVVSVGSPYDDLSAAEMAYGYILLRNGVNSFQGVSDPYANALTDKARRAGWTDMSADRLAQTALMGFGDEWIFDSFSAWVWQQVAAQSQVFSLFEAVEMKSNPFPVKQMPDEPTVFFVPDNPAHERNLVFDARKIGIQVGFSGKMTEEAVLPTLKAWREQFVKSVMLTIDDTLVNGDTSLIGNINRDGAVTSQWEPYAALTGLRKRAFMDNCNYDADGRSVSVELLNGVRDFMSNPASPDLLWLIPSMGKVFMGEPPLTNIDGLPLRAVERLPLTSSNGRVNFHHPLKNIRDSYLCVDRTGWKVGYRKRISVRVDYMPQMDQYLLTVTLRLAFVPLRARAVSMLYNVRV